MTDLYALPAAMLLQHEGSGALADRALHTQRGDTKLAELKEQPLDIKVTSKRDQRKVDNSSSEEEVVDVLNCDGSPQLAALEGEHYDHKGMGYGLTERAKDKMTGAGVIRMSGRLRSDEGMEMVELNYEDLEEDEGRLGGDDDRDEDAGTSFDDDSADIAELKAGSGVRGMTTHVFGKAWWAVRQVEWSEILLHDALPPFVSYWGLWMFAFGFTWGPIVQWLAFIPLAVASLTCLFKTALVGRTTDWSVEGNDFVERLFGLTFPSVLFPLGLLLVHLKRLDALTHASWPVVLIPFWTIYLLFLSFPVVSLVLHATLQRTVGTVGRFECSWFYLIKWPLLIPTIVFNIMLSAREDLPWVVAFLPLCLALFSSLMSCFYMHLPNTKEVDRFMNYEADHIQLLDDLDAKDVV